MVLNLRQILYYSMSFENVIDIGFRATGCWLKNKPIERHLCNLKTYQFQNCVLYFHINSFFCIKIMFPSNMSK